MVQVNSYFCWLHPHIFWTKITCRVFLLLSGIWKWYPILSQEHAWIRVPILLAYPGVNIQKDVENPMGVPKKMYKLAYNPIEVEFVAIAMPKKVENQFLKKN